MAPSDKTTEFDNLLNGESMRPTEITKPHTETPMLDRDEAKKALAAYIAADMHPPGIWITADGIGRAEDYHAERILSVLRFDERHHRSCRFLEMQQILSKILKVDEDWRMDRVSTSSAMERVMEIAYECNEEPEPELPPLPEGYRIEHVDQILLLHGPAGGVYSASHLTHVQALEHLCALFRREQGKGQT